MMAIIQAVSENGATQYCTNMIAPSACLVAAPPQSSAITTTLFAVGEHESNRATTTADSK